MAIAGKLFVRKIRTIDSTVISSLLRGSSCVWVYRPDILSQAMPLISGMMMPSLSPPQF